MAEETTTPEENAEPSVAPESPPEAAQPEPQPSSSPSEPEELVEVSKAGLGRLMDRMEQLESDNEMLKAVSDKGRLANWMQKNREEMPREYQLSTLEGNIIVRWDNLKENYIGKDPKTETWEERQTMVIYYEGSDEGVEIPYRMFNSREMISATLVETRELADRTIVFKLNVGDRELEIDSRFVN